MSLEDFRIGYVRCLAAEIANIFKQNQWPGSVTHHANGLATDLRYRFSLVSAIPYHALVKCYLWIRISVPAGIEV